MCLTFDLIGEILQVIGVVVVLGSQLVFVVKARRKYKNLQTAFLDITAARYCFTDEEFKELSKNKEKLRQAFGEFPHAKILYEDFIVSIFGLIITLAGLIIALF